jgi:hypothetical protein
MKRISNRLVLMDVGWGVLSWAAEAARGRAATISRAAIVIGRTHGFFMIVISLQAAGAAGVSV